eukprot:1483484-Rhodomonas_salina.1
MPEDHDACTPARTCSLNAVRTRRESALQEAYSCSDSEPCSLLLESGWLVLTADMVSQTPRLVHAVSGSEDEQDGDSQGSHVASLNQTKSESQGLSGADFV